MNPLISYILATYKQEKYIRAALEGAVSQDYDNLEIVVSDDCSPDNTFREIQDFVSNYSGPHKIIVNRNEKNLGLVGHLNKILSLTHGKYIVLAAGDDISFPDRCKVSYKAIVNSNVSSISFSNIIIDGEGKVTDDSHINADPTIYFFSLDDYLHDRYKSGGCARIISRQIIDEFGMLNDDCPTEDTTFNLRAFLLGGIGKCETPLVYYRVHGKNVSKGTNYFEYVNPQLIYNQYLKDTNTALKKGLINEETYKLVKGKIDYYLLKENALQKMYYKHSIFKRTPYLLYFIFSSKGDAALKKLLVKRFLSWTKNGY